MAEGGGYSSIREGRLLLCEGTGDNSFFEHLLPKRGIHDYQVVPEPAGRSSFERRLRAIKASRVYAERKISGIVIVSDNDEDPKQSFEEVKEQLKLAESFPVPDQPFTTASAINVPKIAVFMFPDKDEKGALETLILKSISAKYPVVREQLDKFVECTPANGWLQSKRSKMMLQCMVASVCEADPNSSLTHLWSKDREMEDLLDHACFDAVIQFLKEF